MISSIPDPRVMLRPDVPPPAHVDKPFSHVFRPEPAPPAVRKVPASALAWRFATGAPLDGVRRTDATWFRAGSVTYPTSRRAGTWSHLPRAQRAAWRWGTLVFTGLTLYGLSSARALTIVLLVWCLAGAGTHGARTLRRYMATYTHERDVLAPLAAGLAAVLGTNVRTHRRRAWVQVPR